MMDANSSNVEWGKNSRSMSSSSSWYGSEYTSDSGSSLGGTKGSMAYNIEEGQQQDCTGPPFTIQRVAKVLLMPERVSFGFFLSIYYFRFFLFR